MDAADDDPSAPQDVAATPLAADAVIGGEGSVVFVTTGVEAGAAFGESPVQIALTPSIAFRVAEALKIALQEPDLETRQALLGEWAGREQQAMPHAVLEASERGVRVGIEPLGTGSTVPVLWRHVPALALQLDAAARRHLSTS